jgi:hypothetical protein
LSLRWFIVKKVLRYCSTIELQAFKSVKEHLWAVVSASSIESAWSFRLILPTLAHVLYSSTFNHFAAF